MSVLPALEQVDAILGKGVEAGAFPPYIEPLQLHIAIFALNYFCVSNRWTLGAFLGRDLMAEQGGGVWQDWVWNMVEKPVACYSRGGQRRAKIIMESLFRTPAFLAFFGHGRMICCRSCGSDSNEP
jgi:Tetracyclin repressor-like, C-terminal domain